MSKVEVRNYIMDLMCKNIQFNNENSAEIIKKSYNCLGEIIKILYNDMKCYMQVIANITHTNIQNNNDVDVKIAAIELWNDIAYQEKLRQTGRSSSNKILVHVKKSLKIISTYNKIILPPILMC